MSGVVYLVATPIGNLKDITNRALETLAFVDCIFSEDSRVSAKLLSHYKINKKLYVLHKYNELETFSKIQNLLEDNKNLAIISDAGTPCISDPGAYIVDLLYKNNYKIVPIPGASSLSTALSVSGFLNNNKILFLGFLPHKESQIKGLFEEIKSYNIDSIIFFESPKRIKKTINLIKEAFDKPLITITRELTKIYEEIIRFDSSTVDHEFKELGEYTVQVKLPSFKKQIKNDKLSVQLANYLNISSKDAYKLLNKLKKDYLWKDF